MNDEPLYDVVATEIQQGHLKPGLWTKAFADANGDQTKARVIYIRQRVAQLQQETIEAVRNRQESERNATQEQQAREQIAERKRIEDEFNKRYSGSPLYSLARVIPLPWLISIAVFILILFLAWLTNSK